MPDSFSSKGEENPLLTLGHTKEALKLFMGTKPGSQREERGPCQGKAIHNQMDATNQTKQSKQTKKVGKPCFGKKGRGSRKAEVSNFQSISVYYLAVSEDLILFCQ